MLAYSKFAGPTPRLLILRSQYWLDGACLNAAHQLGWEVETVPVVAAGVLPRESVAQLMETLAHFRPDFLLTINLSGMDTQGLFAQIFGDLAIPYVTWFVDDPRTILMDRDVFATEYAVALTWEAAYEPYLRTCGYPLVACMPLAVDPHLFNAEPPESWQCPPTFVGNSMIDFAEREWAWIDEREELATAMRKAFDEGHVTRERFAAGLDHLLSDALVYELDADERRHSELLFFIEGTRRRRHALADALVPLGMQLRGDNGWENAFTLAGGGVHYEQELATFYRDCPININTTSIQMLTAVNQRVFDCPAAGGFLLTDAQASLDELFDVESETARYGSLDECRELLLHFQKHPQQRRAITERARKRILGEHTYAHRLERIAALLKDKYGT